MEKFEVETLVFAISLGFGFSPMFESIKTSF